MCEIIRSYGNRPPFPFFHNKRGSQVLKGRPNISSINCKYFFNFSICTTPTSLVLDVYLNHTNRWNAIYCYNRVKANTKSKFYCWYSFRKNEIMQIFLFINIELCTRKDAKNMNNLAFFFLQRIISIHNNFTFQKMQTFSYLI